MGIDNELERDAIYWTVVKYALAYDDRIPRLVVRN
jgi:hypothetical protein